MKGLLILALALTFACVLVAVGGPIFILLNIRRKVRAMGGIQTQVIEVGRPENETRPSTDPKYRWPLWMVWLDAELEKARKEWDR